jgi:hypothetical protein
LTSLKLDRLRLDDSIQQVHGWVNEGREVANVNKLTGKVEGDNIAVDGSLFLSGTAFDDCGQP